MKVKKKKDSKLNKAMFLNLFGKIDEIQILITDKMIAEKQKTLSIIKY